MDVRVRLEFADDVGRHVLRRRGFSSCWYLVPKDAKLVGDLAHALQREFELRKRCPQGLELRLEELPLLATQSIRIVRDDDTIVVQCPVVEDALVTSETSESEEERTNLKRRKRKEREKEGQPKKKLKETPSRQTAQRTSALLLQESQSGKVESSSSISSSSDSESSSESASSSSSSDSEDESTSQQLQQRKTRQNAAKKQQPGKSNGVGLTSNGVASKPNGFKQTGKEPRRRRRRLRQRNGRRQLNGNQEPSSADNSAEQMPQSGNDGSAVRSQEMPPKISSVPSRLVSNSTSSRDYSRNKGHVLFDEETGNQVIVHHGDDNSDARENKSSWTAQRSKAPELAKYGPSCSSHQQPNPTRDVPADVVLNRGKEISSYDETTKPKGKGKYEERWKRPYEIVATVLDKTSTLTNKPDLTASLSSYPTGSASSVDLKDIIAFKTLTLCLETWQPKLSEWQCGQVQSVDATSSSIEVSKWILKAIGDSVKFSEAPQSEQQIIPISEISELRFLSGPSHSSLQKAGN